MKDAKKLPHTVLAEGETTGHAHRAAGPRVGLYETSNGGRVLSVPERATVAHEEHLPIDLPAGKYDVVAVREFDHWAEESRAVVD